MQTRGAKEWLRGNALRPLHRKVAGLMRDGTLAVVPTLTQSIMQKDCNRAQIWFAKDPAVSVLTILANSGGDGRERP